MSGGEFIGRLNSAPPGMPSLAPPDSFSAGFASQEASDVLVTHVAGVMSTPNLPDLAASANPLADPSTRSSELATRSHPDEEEEQLSADDSDLIVGVAAELDLNESYFDDVDDSGMVDPSAVTTAAPDAADDDDDEVLELEVDPAVASAARGVGPVAVDVDAAAVPSSATNLSPVDMLRFQRWMHCFAVVTFDLELGQALECVFPPVNFTESEKSNICFNAFADSNSSSIGDTEYTFRIRWPSGADPLSPPKQKFLYGFVFFRQCKDDRIRRGYFQKSVVLLTERPFVGLFRQVLRMLAATYFDVGHPILESASHTIARWPLTTPESPLELPFLGSMLYYTIPAHLNGSVGFGAMRKSSFELAPNQFSLSSCAANIFHDFRDILADLWTFWELSLIAEPIVVMSSSPALCADVVLGALALISPVAYGGDFRPYFTIHDTDFKEYTTRTKTPANVLLGVTNPFFVKAFEHWPHILRVGAAAKKKGGGGSLDFVPGLRTAYKRHVSVDRRLLKAVMERNVDEDSANALLLNHFQELTNAFLKPIETYFSTLVPSVAYESGEKYWIYVLKRGLNRAVSAFEPLPRLLPFEAVAFLATVEGKHAAELKTRFKSNIIELYHRFLRSPNFVAWLRDKTRQANRMLRKLYVKSMIEIEPERLEPLARPQLEALLDRVNTELDSFTCRAWVGASGVKRLEQLANTIDGMLA